MPTFAILWNRELIHQDGHPWTLEVEYNSDIAIAERIFFLKKKEPYIHDVKFLVILEES